MTGFNHWLPLNQPSDNWYSGSFTASWKKSTTWSYSRHAELFHSSSRKKKQNEERNSGAEEQEIWLRNGCNQEAYFQEDYSRRNNIRIDGVEERPNEKWEIMRLVREKLVMGGVQLERAHHVGSSFRDLAEISHHCCSILPALRPIAGSLKFTQTQEYEHISE